MPDTPVVLPSLGDSVDQATVVEVLVVPGDSLQVDTPVLEVSTDKVDTEVPAGVVGVVVEIRVAAGDVVVPGDVILVLGAKAPSPSPAAASAGSPASAPAPAPAAPAPTPAAPAAPPAAVLAGDPHSARTPPGPRGAVLVSPAVRALVDQFGVTIDDVRGAGKGGRVTAPEVAEHVRALGLQPVPVTTAQRVPEPAATSPGPTTEPTVPTALPVLPSSTEGSTTHRLSRRRQIIASRMRDSLAGAAQLTSVVEVDMTAAMSAVSRNRTAFQSRWQARLTPLALIARATCLALARHPSLNASLDLTAGIVVHHHGVNLGLAVDTADGLVVPNVKEADTLTAGALAQRIADLAERAKDGGLRPDDVKGGTFTITNTGSLGSLLDTPILNPPEVGILAATRVERRPVVRDMEGGETIAIRDIAYLCLTYDHQLVDGADAVRFLRDVADVLGTYAWDDDLT